MATTEDVSSPGTGQLPMTATGRVPSERRGEPDDVVSLAARQAGAPVETAASGPALEAARACALETLRSNDGGGFTRPSARLYGHQWLWDSCFVAIGLRHVDVERAAAEVVSLFTGQWPNGMLPHIRFCPAAGEPYHADPRLWGVRKAVEAPPAVETSGVTQPPLVAEAVARVGEVMPARRRLAFYRQVLPGLIAYHEWLYRERDPGGSGLVAVVHPWESGMDDTPPWSAAVRHLIPARVRAVRDSGAVDVLDGLRRDNRTVPARERIAADELFTLYELTRRLRAAHYRFAEIEAAGLPAIRDVGFNAVLVRANHQLEMVAADAGQTLPPGLRRAMRTTQDAFANLLADGFPRHQDARTGRPLPDETVAGFLALYAGAVPPEQVGHLAGQLFGPRWTGRYGPASVPFDAPAFDPCRYWRGPVWPMVNWLLADGLARSGRAVEARRLREDTVELVTRSSRPYEYYSPVDGAGHGAPDFAPTAAVVLDMLRAE
ncbi:glycoside hydrolase [Frankia sp. CNm7]|uniref:Glycoside hydrolase n=1 Tax=Frankia nepalensis TaxID=1836974 RepID=A0A937RIR1_9ACTN|nr:glycoside hydrolase [Frankia nepalensis]MBL7498813.1 glycoside hydrolase [Frankia nepalensis]MBL7508618.1 glycoside hydrolase [Frankia nepalensis]MBL7517464.1 glycoside hydrolase [Frankia nepalensis]MBL7629710.1 glycoside hydrolase [Frankia nepalensis]